MKKIQNDQRILGRRVAKQLSPEVLKTIGGGRTTCCNCVEDDCGPAVQQ